MNTEAVSNPDGMELGGVMGKGELVPYAQPVYDLNRQRVVGAELLARWSAGGTVYAPALFIPRLEKCGLIHRLDMYMFEQACRLLERWQALYPSLLLSVNQSRVTIDQPDYVRTLESLAERHHFHPGSLIVEFTESTLCRHASLPAVVDALRRYGFQVAVDDFGSGWSSLGLLARIQVDWLKLDQCFLDDRYAQRNRVLLEYSIALAKTLDMQVLCEGVEKKGQEDLLRSLGCTMAQGYRFGRPMSVGKFEALLDTQDLILTEIGGATG